MGIGYCKGYKCSKRRPTIVEDIDWSYVEPETSNILSNKVDINTNKIVGMSDKAMKEFLVNNEPEGRKEKVYGNYLTEEDLKIF